MRKIAVLTSGGDAPGMNAAIRAVVRCAIAYQMDVYGVESGYEGLVAGKVVRLDSRSVSDTIQRGGTILKTSRSNDFIDPKNIKKACDVLRAYGIEGLVVIGGDGSFRGMKDITDMSGITTVGIPGTIDNDLAYTDFTLGFDTACNTVINAINNIRDTMTSHDRACIIEVMGRHCGDIALYAGIAGGAECIIVPEHPFDIEEICDNMRKNIIKGKVSDIILLSEGVCGCDELKAQIEARLPIIVRTIKLGYLQRGGSPSMRDRVFAARCAERAVELLRDGLKGSRAVGISGNQIIDIEISEALSIKRAFDEKLYSIAAKLSF